MSLVKKTPLNDILSPEIFRELQMHLKPRHLAKLLQTCSYLNMLLGSNNEYWTRVAAHLVWRNHVGLVTHEDVSYSQNSVLSRYFDMVNLPRGYKVAMNEFLALISKEMRRVHEDKDDPDADKNPFGWHKFADAPLDIQIRVGMRSFLSWRESEGYDNVDVTMLGMRGIAAKIAICCASGVRDGKTGPARERHMGMVRYINEMDDDNTIPISTKQRLMKGFVRAITSEEHAHNWIRIHLLPVHDIKDFALIMTAE